MRILMISPVLGDAFGQERVMRESAGLLRAAGHQVFFVGERIAGAMPEVDGWECIAGLTSVGLLTGPARVSQIRKSLLSAVEKFRPEVVHLIDQLDGRLMAALTANYPVVFTAHTVAPTCPNSTRLIGEGGVCQEKSGWGCLKNHHRYGCLGFMKTDVHRAIGIEDYRRRRQALLGAQNIFAISRYVERTLLADGYSPEKISLVYNPVAIPKVVPLRSKGAESANGGDEALLVCASRLVPHKGVGHLIRALKPLEALSWELRICGEGPERKPLETLTTNLGLNQRIKFLGHTSFAETQDLMAKARLVAQPNIGPEPFGLSVAEASAMGLPVVGFDLPAINEIVVHDRSGLLATPGNIPGLTENLKALIQDPGLARRLGSEGPSIVARRFSPEAHLDATLSAYASALGQRRAA